MQTSSIYQGMADNYKDQRMQLVEYVVKAYPVEQLYLLGITINSRRTETLFTATSATASYAGHYYLLALVKRKDDYTLNCIQDKIEQTVQHYIPATAIVLSICDFNKWLLQGHVFAKSVADKGLKLYDAGRIVLNEGTAVDEEVLKRENEQLVYNARMKVQEFIAGAELYCLRKQYNMAAFMLHQAAEQALRALIIIQTGLRINTHSIDKLMRYCSMFDYKLPDLFAKHNERDMKLYQLLQRAYIDARYRPDYSIKEVEIREIMEKVKKASNLTIRGFENVSFGTFSLTK
jgi:HEPN domain-containing protein